MDQSESKENVRTLLVHEQLNNNVNYITKDVVDRQFEVQVREDLLKAYDKMQSTVSQKRQKLKFLALGFPKEFGELRICDILKDLGQPKSTEEVLASLENVVKLTGHTAPLPGNLFSGLPPLPPSAKLGFVTPSSNRIPVNATETFQSAFGMRIPPSTIKKQPRPARPGEAVYTFSATGSPVLVESLPSSSASIVASESSARVKIEAGNGQVFDVGLVFRGAPVDVRNQIVTDFRCWARTRSAMQTRKLLPHRAIGKKHANSLNNKKQKV